MSDDNPYRPAYQAGWLGVFALVSLDYLTTLSYQPSLAFRSAGLLTPLASLVIVAVTWLAIVPTYLVLVGRSPGGGGAIALLERLIFGWRGKFIVVALLGFLATDFVFTRTFCAASAAEHLTQNGLPHWQAALDALAAHGAAFGQQWDNPVGHWLAVNCSKQLIVTLLLVIISTIFGLALYPAFNRKALIVSVVVLSAYLAMNVFVIGSGLVHLAVHPEKLQTWWQQVWAGDWKVARDHGPQTWWSLTLACLGLFPSLALGLSGYEILVSAVPLIKPKTGDPSSNIGDARKLVLLTALVGTIAIFASALVSTVLIPVEEFRPVGAASHRAIAYLAHGQPLVGGESAGILNPVFGIAFGTVFDLVAVTTLVMAGASVGVGLRELIPPYLHRLGMQLDWTFTLGVLPYFLMLVKLGITLAFKADLEAQRHAYATAVLFLLTAAAWSVALDRWKSRASVSMLRRRPWWFGFCAIGFAAATVAEIFGQPGGAAVAAGFVVIMLFSSMVSRAVRSTELRFDGFEFQDAESEQHWDYLTKHDTPMLVLRSPNWGDLDALEERARKWHRLPDGSVLVVVEAELSDPSEFQQRPLLKVTRQGDRFSVAMRRCTSLSHALAVVAVELAREGAVPEIHCQWSNESPLTANLHFVLFGHGNVPWMVHTLIQAASLPPERRPRVMVG